MSTLCWGMPITRFPFSSGCCRSRMALRLLRRCCGSIRCGIKSATILAFRNWPQERNHESEELLRRSKRRNVFKVAVAYAVTSWLSYYSFWGLLVKIVKAERSNANSAEFCFTLCVTRLPKNGHIPDDVR